MRVLGSATCVALILSAAVPVRGEIAGASVTTPTFDAQISPRCVTATPDGNIWFSDERTTPHKIGFITPAGHVTQFPVPCTRCATGEELVYIWSLTAGPDGNVWFIYHHASSAGPPIDNWVGSVTPSGTFNAFPISNATSAYGHPAITSGPDGNLWFTENGANKIGRVTPSGTVTEFALSSFSAPSLIVAGPDGNLWFTETLAGKIGRITTAGVITEFPVGGGPLGLAFGADGNLWFTKRDANRIGRMTTAGVATDFAIPRAGSSPQHIVAGPDGNLWFTEFNGQQVGRVTLSSSPVLEFIDTPGTENFDIAFSAQPFAKVFPLETTKETALLSAYSLTAMYDVPLRLTIAAPAKAEPDLAISKYHDYSPPRPFDDNNGYLSYYLNISNIGAAPTSGTIHLSDLIPRAVIVDTERLPDVCQFNAFSSSLTCDLNEVILPGESVIVVVRCVVNATDGTVITNQATVSGGGDKTPANNTSNVDTFVPGQAGLTVTKNHKTALDGVVQWEIRITNYSGVPTSGPVRVDDPLPAGVTLKPFGDTTGGSCTLSAGIVVCRSDGPLGAHQSITFALPIDTLPADGTVKNVAIASSTDVTPVSSKVDVITKRSGKVIPNPAIQTTKGR